MSIAEQMKECGKDQKKQGKAYGKSPDKQQYVLESTQIPHSQQNTQPPSSLSTESTQKIPTYYPPQLGSITLHSFLDMLLVHKLHQGPEKNGKLSHDEALSPGELKANRKC